MLKADWKQNIILVVFSLLMFEVLTKATFAFVAIGILLVFFNIRTTKLIRNILAVGVFVSYWLTYGKIIDPEVGLNFLTSIIVLKILEKETVRDRYMIFFGLILLISAGSLFERTLTYVIFFAISFFILVRDFYSYLGQKWRLKELGKALIWTLPLSALLFFFVPRLINPIPFQEGKPGVGEIGYTPDVSVSEIESLVGNQTPVFQVLVNRSLNQNELYWRGNTLSYNDGWNWPVMVQDKETGRPLLGTAPLGQEVLQNFRVFTRSEYFFSLDVPRTISFGKNIAGLGPLRSLEQRRWNQVQKYQVISDPRVLISEAVPASHYLQTGLTRVEKNFIQENFKGNNISELRSSIQDYFDKNKFSYSLSPGRSQNFMEFMNRKIGLCSHYASSVALIMRTQGIPTRLVSGFLGGSYNHFAGFYMVSQNDAHVWLEAFEGGQWQRLDPTEWLVPERVSLGGEAFMEVADSSFRMNSFIRLPGVFKDMKLWFEQWDFLFYQWLEEIDYQAQEAWFSKINFKRQWLFTFLPMVMVVFMLVYSWFISTRKRNLDESEFHELWRIFYSKMSSKGLKLSNISMNDADKVIREYDRPEITLIWNELIDSSFNNGKALSKNLKKRIQRL